MKKRIIRITILVISLFLVFGIKAAEKEFNISEVNTKYQEYNNAVKESNANNCNGKLYTKIEVNKCNDYERTKARSLTYLYNAKAYDKDLISDEIQTLLDNNSNICTSVISNNLQDAINKVYTLFYIAGPILLILFGTIDLTNIIVSGDEKQRKAAYRRLGRRIAALALLFAAPVLVNILINTFSRQRLSGNRYSCKYQEKKITLSYVVRKSGSAGDGKTYGASTGSSVVKLDKTSDRDSGEYVVVNTKYPGSVKGYSDMLIKNGICQTSTGADKACISSYKAPNGWGDCCAGIAQIQACGLKKGMSLTQSKAGLIVGNKGCNNPKNNLGCTGIWAWNKNTCFATEAEYVQFIIKKIQEGTPVMTVVGDKSRHFVTIVGFKKDTNGTSHDDLLLLDSWDGRLESFKKRKIGKKSNLGSSHPCKNVSGAQYWASPVIAK